MTDEAIKILSLVGVPTVFTALYGYIIRRIKRSDVKNKAIALGIQAILRDRIIQAYNHYHDQGYCPIYARENIENMYNQYHNLGGNGTITDLYNELRKLPTEERNINNEH